MATLFFANVDDAILEPILKPDHAEWLRTAGLRPFAALKWNDRDIPRDDLVQFLANFSGDKTTINGVEVDLSSEALCRIFRLGHGNNNAYKRPIGWISKVAPSFRLGHGNNNAYKRPIWWISKVAPSAAKSANRYLMSSLPPNVCARIAFLKATLHLVQKAADGSMSVVRQAEEPDGTWDWGPQFVEKLKAKWKLNLISLKSGSIVTTASHIRIILMHHRMRLEKRSTTATTVGPAGDEIPGEGASSEDADESEVGGSSINSGPGNGVPLSRKRRKLVHIGECSGGATPTLNPESAPEFEHFPATTSQEPGMKSAPEQAEKIIRQCTTAATKTAASSGPVGRPEADLIRNTHRRVVQALKEDHNIYRGKKMTQNGHEPVDLRVLNLEYALLKANAELKDLDEAADAADILEKMRTMVEAQVQTDDFLSTDVDVGLQLEPGDREQRGLAVCGISDVNKLKDKMVELETGISDGVHKEEKLKLEFDAKCKEVSDLTTKVGHFQKSDEAKSSRIQLLEKQLEEREQTEKQLLPDLDEARATKDNEPQKLDQAAKETEKKHQEAMESLRNDLSVQAQRTTTVSIDLRAKCEEVSDLTTKVGHFQKSDEAKSSRIRLLEKELEEREQTEEQLLHDLDEARAVKDNELQKLAQAAKETEKKQQEAIDGVVKLKEDAEILKQQVEKEMEAVRNRNRFLEEQLGLYIKYNDDLQLKLDLAREDVASSEEVIIAQSAILASRQEDSRCGVHGAARQEKLWQPWV